MTAPNLASAALVFATLTLAAAPARAAEWRGYDNARFGYTIEVPADFAMLSESDSGDGATFAAPDGKAELLVFSTFLVVGSFRDEMAGRHGFAAAEGWQLSYQRTTDNWGSFSGTRDGEILYGRGIAFCDGGAAFFQITYPREQASAYDPVIEHMVETLKGPETCPD